MLVSDFDFALPNNLIAQYPLTNRGDSRLLTAKNNTITDHYFSELTDFLQPNDIIVRNNTKVIPARLFGRKSTGGKIEIMVERVLDNSHLLALIKSNKTPKIGAFLKINGGFSLQITGRKLQFFVLELTSSETINFLLEKHGHIPLPPYIKREDNSSDLARYQTIYAKKQGAVAAPTAGLHFDQSVLQKIEEIGVETVEITLHIGVGTFQPVRVDDTNNHKMHQEWVHISQEVCDKIQRAKSKNGRIIAVGTTSLRALESASSSGLLQPKTGETDIFITPGFKFQTVDLLLTNFHLPKSTLMMLVSAFSGTDEIKKIYQHAIAEKYRFFSYGDAMLLHKK